MYTPVIPTIPFNVLVLIIFIELSFLINDLILIIPIDNIFDFEINFKERKNIIEKASICINGVSLTISKVTKNGFKVWVIPHTLKLTNIKYLNKKDLVNIEIDILSKYIKKFLNEKK